MTPQSDLELTIGGERIALKSATLRDVGGQKSLVLATGPQACPTAGTETRPWDVYVIARWPPSNAASRAAQITVSGARLPSDLAVIGDDVALHERPPVDPSAVDVAIDILRPPSRFPIGLHGIAHAKRCPPLR